MEDFSIFNDPQQSSMNKQRSTEENNGRYEAENIKVTKFKTKTSKIYGIN